jgi:hypothetical protein
MKENNEGLIKLKNQKNIKQKNNLKNKNQIE